MTQKILPIVTVLIAVLILWYAAAVWLNAPQAEALMDPDQPHGLWALAQACWSMDRPVLPAPDQIASALIDSVFGFPLSSPRNLLLQAGYTAATTVIGLIFGLIFGILLAIGIVHVRTLDRSVMPWVIASQTIPILAIAPMLVVALGSMGVTGLTPKAAIVAYLTFFPVTVGMVKGFRTPDPLQLDLMHTYSAGEMTVFAKLRWPAGMAFLFPSLKVAVALAVTGAIVAEMPTGAQVGLGARLLAGSYYGQTMMMWSALVMASLLALAGLLAVTLLERGVVLMRGGRL
ncbi:ABC transporter permease subunit [Acidisoma cellulosilytica]|uniref:ABC transporter permease subunit n=1 Tax=Acidisoma cellulosilyticum TaxID=2802395 RepID=A0A963Z0Q6_9PROT|nr:ABC transporter permease subunit [Acidisoma cellulosilyticum]MCB8880579.1 ABC transporter permease subunit [Acidisoma cellulosilyticum]